MLNALRIWQQKQICNEYKFVTKAKNNKYKKVA